MNSLSPETQLRPSFSDSLLVGTSIFYLALPNILFILGWLQPLPALVLIFSILVSIVRLTCRNQLSAQPSTGRRSAVGTGILLAILALCWVFSTGMMGHTFQQYDYIVRNAVFATLVRCDWPIILPDHADFIYYLASWLPPALAARIHPSGSFPMYCLGVWCFLGVFLMCLLMQKKLGTYSLLFLLFLIVTDCLGSWFVVFCPDLILTCPAFYYFLSNGSSLQLQLTFHHVIPVWIVLSLYFSGSLSWNKAVSSSSFVLLCSPLGSIGLAAFFLFVLLTDYKKAVKNILALLREPAFYSGCLLAIVAALYFASNIEGASFSWLWQRLVPDTPFYENIFWAFCGGGLTICLILLLACILKQLHNSLLWFVVGMLALLPVFIIGIKFNELLFKASCIPFWILALLLTQWVKQADRKSQVLIIAFAVLSSGGTCSMLNLCYRGIRQPHDNKLQLSWNWHLYHPEHVWYPQFKGKINATHLFYTEAGASSQTLLFWSGRDNRSDRESLPPLNPWSGGAARPKTSTNN